MKRSDVLRHDADAAKCYIHVGSHHSPKRWRVLWSRDLTRSSPFCCLHLDLFWNVIFIWNLSNVSAACCDEKQSGTVQDPTRTLACALLLIQVSFFFCPSRSTVRGSRNVGQYRLRGWEIVPQPICSGICWRACLSIGPSLHAPLAFPSSSSWKLEIIVGSGCLRSQTLFSPSINIKRRAASRESNAKSALYVVIHQGWMKTRKKGGKKEESILSLATHSHTRTRLWIRRNKKKGSCSRA